MALLLLIGGSYLLLMPAHGCSAPVVEAFRDRVAAEQVGGSVGYYHCGPIARAGAPCGALLVALGMFCLLRSRSSAHDDAPPSRTTGA